MADVLFRILLGNKFRRHGERQTASVKKLLINLLEGRGELSLNRCIFKADRGYAKESIMDTISSFGLGSIFIMPDNFMGVNPFVAQYRQNPNRSDLEEM